MAAIPFDFLRVDASLGLLDAEYTDYLGFVGSGQFVSVPAQPTGTLLAADLSSLKLRRAPRVTASIAPNFNFDVGGASVVIGGLGRFIDKQFVEFFNSQRGVVPSTWTWDASAGVGFGGPDRDRFRVTVFGRNLSNVQRISSFTNSLVDFSTVSVGRTWGVEFLTHF